MLRQAFRPVLSSIRTCRYSTSRVSTIDKAEVQKFSDKSAEWWDPDGEFGMLHLLNSPRVAYVRDQLNRPAPHPLKGLRLLDIGCGGGLLSETLCRLGGDVVGADASSDNIKMANLHARKDPKLKTLEYRHATAEDLLAAGESFDVVLAMEIIEHVNQPFNFLKTCADLTRPGGDLFLSTMSRTPAAYALTVLLAEDILGLVHKGTHDWSKYIKSREMKDAVHSFGEEWTVKDIRGIAWDPIRRKWTVSEQNGVVGIAGMESLEINYIMRAVKRSQTT
ncbi:hypothetical protein DFQ28_009589 [Apophysomyces sp. BC1034]|nr:hypothetical protein DFQ30_010845 [Apophysomyces sp. BC1015]KAG0169718.1 hypothetical protein DFQ29_009571 [Apophysomyces sp. BC1021]KAG0192268.1 hypothetical protein DFQ28_009589 [Apophysomyces sp. BC1034]